MNVKELRKLLGLTQVELANMLCVAPLTVRRWEKDRAIPSPMAQKQLDRLREKAHKSQID
jgi:DNA-binding transcriptional regulator YiaG